MSITQGVTQHTTMTEKNVDTPHTVAELRDWLMVESRDSVSLVNLLISLPAGWESKKDMGSDPTLLRSPECIALEAAKAPLAIVKDLKPKKHREDMASSE
mmetsp:Transcript_7922/g.23676  ORF Transcript_7922/g.23676 Transcript_7922/m.23676 type:complete len:100 (+) Transcript_7922:2660-2959(+)